MRDQSPDRRVRLRILTERGWIEGSLQLPRVARLVDWLNHTASFLTISDVRIGDTDLPYLSLRKKAVRLVAPVREEDVSSYVTAGVPTPRRIWCMLEDGSLRGTLDVLEHVRVSDFLAHHGGFVGLRDAHLHRRDASGQDERVALVTAIVPLEGILGVAEEPTTIT
jgi:hypothetical protein